MKSILITLALLALTSCATYTPMPKSDAVKTYIEDVQASEKQGYINATTYLSKHLSDSNSAIKMSDKENNRIITRISYVCNSIPASAIIDAGRNVLFNLDIAFKQNKVKIEVEVLGVVIPEISPGPIMPDATKTKEVGSCMDSLKNEIVAAISKKHKEW